MSVRVHEPPRRPQFVRLSFTPRVTCPAGTPVFETSSGAACRCAIEQNTITAKDDPTSLAVLCCGRYDACATWRADKERIAAGNHDALLDQDDTPRRPGAWVEELGIGTVEYEPVEYTDYYVPE